MTTSNESLQQWIDEIAAQMKPDTIHWCDGSEDEYQRFIDEALETGVLNKLNDSYKNCYLHRSDPTDVARVEHQTFICTDEEEDTGPNNHWMKPEDAHVKMADLYAECMQGRTMYVIPYCMGPLDSPYSRCGVEVTDSLYVAINMQLMTRMGKPALERIEKESTFVRGQHSIGELDPDRRFFMHYPDELLIQSYGSGYGGNALLGKKCHALRIASSQARTEGWLAEHMLIVEIENPEGEKHYLAAAFPSACGKTNLAMLIPPESHAGWKVRTIGDDIAWLHFDANGQLRAINPEAGYFGVIPGTNEKTNPNAYETIQSDTIFTNAAVTESNEPWWEEKTTGKPAIDWKGNPYTGEGPAAHPNSRFTVSARKNPAYSPLADDPAGVPISAIIFGGRRRELAPLVYQAKDWNHGVLIGASVASEMTAAAAGTVGVVRRDPMAMKPFCGYNFADYWDHWLKFGERSDNMPKIFHCNWFRRDEDGRFLWPGFGDNLRVLRWIIDRCANRTEALETPIGYLPRTEDIDTSGLDMQASDMETLLNVDTASWRDEMQAIGEYFQEYGERIPEKLKEEHQKIVDSLG